MTNRGLPIMNQTEMKQAYRMLEGRNVARLEGNPNAGTIQIIFMGGWEHTVESFYEANQIHSMFWPSSKNNEVDVRLFMEILGCHD